MLEHFRTVTWRPDGLIQTHLKISYLLEDQAAAAAFADMSYSYNPARARKWRVRAQVLRRFQGGREAPVVGAVSISKPAASVKEPVLTVHVRCRALKAGDVVVVDIDRLDVPLMPKHFFTYMPVSLDVLTQRAGLEVRTPAGANLVARAWGCRPKFSRKREGDQLVWSWQFPNGAAAWQPIRPTQARPAIMIVSPATWEDVRRWFADIYLPRISQSAQIKRLAAEIAGPSPQDYERAVQQIGTWVLRNIGLGRLQLGEEAWVPRPPEEVLRRKTGDCKDRAVLMASLLRAAGMMPHLAVTCLNYSLPPLNQIPPNPYVFDHCLVAVSGPGRAYWIDPTGRAENVWSKGWPIYALLLDRSPATLSRVPRFYALYPYEQKPK